MTSIEDAVTYPMEHDDWLKTILIGGLLSLFSFLIVPILLVYGYVVRAIRRSLEGDPQPPVFDDWGTLAVDGLQAVVILIVYMIVPAIVGAVTVGGSIAAIAGGGRAGAAAGFAGVVLSALLTFVVTLVFGYVAVAAIVNFAREGTLGAGFAFDTIKSVIFHREYAVAWLLSVGIFIVTGLVTGVLNVVPFLGTIVGVFVGFYAQIVAANLWAGGFSAATGDGGVGSAGVTESTI